MDRNQLLCLYRKFHLTAVGGYRKNQQQVHGKVSKSKPVNYEIQEKQNVQKKETKLSFTTWLSNEKYLHCHNNVYAENVNTHNSDIMTLRGYGKGKTGYWLKR